MACRTADALPPAQLLRFKMTSLVKAVGSCSQLTSSCLPAVSSALAGTLKLDRASILFTAAWLNALCLGGVLYC